MADPFNSIPGNTLTININDLRSAVLTENTVMLLPKGEGGTAQEGEAVRFSELDDTLEKLIGDNAQLKLYIKGYSEGSNKATVIGLPFDPGDKTPATAKINFSYSDNKVSTLGEGTLVFTMNGQRYEVSVSDGETIEQLIESMAIVVNSDLDFTAEADTTKNTQININTVELGTLANSSSFKFVYGDEAFVLPSNLKLPSDISFEGGSQTRDLSEVISKVYKTVIRQGVRWFLYPYNDIDVINQIHAGLDTLYKEQKIENIDFAPVPQILVRPVIDMDDAKEFREKVNHLNTAFVPLLQDWDDQTYKAGLIAGNIDQARVNRINVSRGIAISQLDAVTEFEEDELSELLHHGVSPLINNTYVEICRLVSTYKETTDTQPYNYLSFVIGNAIVVNTIVAFEEYILSKKYLLTRSVKLKNGETNSAILKGMLFTYLDTNLITSSDRVVEDIDANDVSCTRTGDNSVEFNFGYEIPGELNKIHAYATVTIGGTY